MEKIVTACVQPRIFIPASREEFETEARRFLRQAQAKGAQLVIFPELAGVMLAPLLINQVKLGFIKRADQGKQPQAGFVSRSLGRFSGATAGALGGGFLGSLKRLLDKRSDELLDLYIDTFGQLAREFGTAIIGGSLYLYDAESNAIRNRAYVFDLDGEVLGYQDKLNLSAGEVEWATPGTDLTAIGTRWGRLGLLIGQDVLYPELGRLLAIQGADLFVSMVASPGAAPASAVRSALSMRVEENQVYGAASFLLGPDYLERPGMEQYYGQSALLAPISLTEKGDGLLMQTGTNRTEGIFATALDLDALYDLRETSRFQPRREMNLGSLGPVLATMYRDGLTIDQALSQGLAGPVAPLPGVDEWVVPLADTEEVGELSSAEPVEDTMPEPPSEPASEDESEPALEDEIKPVETPETQDIAAMMSLTEPLTEEEEPEQE
ncbi:MAG: nitrilase-related carbon-nitrogen hydrolase [Anaerolineae bacterium]|jgi:predicted amidohydrolase